MVQRDDARGPFALHQAVSIVADTPSRFPRIC